jgi:MoxR-like ATPase
MVYSEVSAPEQTSVSKLVSTLKQHIIGHDNLINSLLIALLADGHILLESMPGLAKTTSAKLLAENINADFHRVQFTPDLLPADLTGSDIYNHVTGSFAFMKGPIFNNIVLADEINRAPAKVQSALLEAMEEKQVTVGQKSYALPELFMVIATQNPIEQEGTYNLPEAQLDRFLLHVVLDYPTAEQELKIINLPKQRPLTAKIDPRELLTIRTVVDKMYVDDKLKEYMVSIAQATRRPELYSKDLAQYIAHGVSPRATLGLLKSAKALAWLQGENYVLPEFIQNVAHDVIRHRLMLSYQAIADNVSKNEIISNLLNLVAVP